jgi:hypothetical protein
MISDSSAMARMALSFTLPLAVRQNARSSANAIPLDVFPQLHWLRRCLAASSRAFMRPDYHTDTQPSPARLGVPPRRHTQTAYRRFPSLVTVPGNDAWRCTRAQK